MQSNLAHQTKIIKSNTSMSPNSLKQLQQQYQRQEHRWLLLSLGLLLIGSLLTIYSSVRVNQAQRHYQVIENQITKYDLENQNLQQLCDTKLSRDHLMNNAKYFGLELHPKRIKTVK